MWIQVLDNFFHMPLQEYWKCEEEDAVAIAHGKLVAYCDECWCRVTRYIRARLVELKKSTLSKLMKTKSLKLKCIFTFWPQNIIIRKIVNSCFFILVILSLYLALPLPPTSGRSQYITGIWCGRNNNQITSARTAAHRRAYCKVTMTRLLSLTVLAVPV